MASRLGVAHICIAAIRIALRTRLQSVHGSPRDPCDVAVGFVRAGLTSGPKCIRLRLGPMRGLAGWLARAGPGEHRCRRAIGVESF